MTISDFYSSMYVDASSYDNLRKIASFTDGLKNSGRKVIATVLDKGITSDVKVSRLKSTVSEHTEYLHGEDNLANVIVNMARRYEGTNNLPLMKDQGNFGKRFINEASADRYISTAGEKYIQYIFPKSDNKILVTQKFEGAEIEPRFLVPIIPMILVNGSPSAISSGFAQNILPRPFKQIITMTEKYLETGKVKVPKPGWEGFRGTVKQGAAKNKWLVYGKFIRKNSTTIEITELPVGVQLKNYTDILDNLQDAKVITSYEDKSDNGKFNFMVRVTRVFSAMTDEEIFEALKLIGKSMAFAENYTSMGDNNRIRPFTNPEDIFYSYAEVRLEFYEKRKKFLIAATIREIKRLASKFFFIKGITEDTILVSKKSKDQIIKQLEKVEAIERDEDGSYDYLLRMPIYSLTTEKMSELKNSIKEQKSVLEDYKNKEPKTFWKEDLTELKKVL